MLTLQIAQLPANNVQLDRTARDYNVSPFAIEKYSHLASNSHWTSGGRIKTVVEMDGFVGPDSNLIRWT